MITYFNFTALMMGEIILNFLSSQDCLSPLSMQALPEPSESLCIVEMGGTEAKEETGEPGTVGGLFLNIGLQVSEKRISLTS